MPNQMIALQGRTPQGFDVGRMVQQNAQLINMMSQQRAADRQAEAFQMQQQRTAQEMQFAAQQRGEQSRAAGQTFDVAEMGRLRNLAVAVERAQDPEAAYQMWLGEVEKADPRSADMFRQASPNYNPDFMLNVIGEADDFIRARVPAATAQTMLGEGGGAFNVVAGMPGVATATPVTVGRAPAAQGTAVTPAATAETPVEAIPSRGGQTAPQDLIEQGVNPASIPMGNPLQRPTSFAPGSADQTAAQPMSMDAAPQIIQAAVQSGNIGENDLQSLRQMVGAQYEPQLAQWMEQNNIRITPAAEPSMRSAVYRPGVDAAPQMQQVQTNAPGTQFRGRDPLTSPSQNPVAAGDVAEATREPIPQAATRAGATTRAERVAEAETAYERERNTRQAQADVDFMQRYPGASETVRNNLQVVQQMIGDARVADGRIVVPRGRATPHPGFEGVVGLGIPGMRLIPGSREADFDSLFSQVTGAAFLEAFETLKGGGSITEQEGQAATRAITRLSRNLSEVEFVRAASELRDIMRRGLERAERRAARISGEPAPAAAQQPRARTARGTSVTGTW